MSDEEKVTKNDSPSFINGLALGALVGAAGFFLFGTKKGRKLKKALLDGSVKTIEDLKKTAKDLEKKGQKIGKKVAVKRVELEKKAVATQKKVTAEIKEAEKELEIAKKKAESLKKKIIKAATIVKRRYFMKKGRSLGK